MNSESKLKKLKYAIWIIIAVWVILDWAWLIGLPHNAAPTEGTYIVELLMIPILWWAIMAMFRIFNSTFFHERARLLVIGMQYMCIYFFSFFSLVWLAMKIASFFIAGEADILAPETQVRASPIGFSMLAFVVYFNLVNRLRLRKNELPSTT